MTSYTLLLTSALSERYGAPFRGNPSYTVTPGTQAPVVTVDEAAAIPTMRWGLRPQWAEKAGSPFDKPSIPYSEIREETTKNRFRQKQVHYLRCLVPVTSFGDMVAPEGEFLSLAAIYDSWKDDKGKDRSSFALITVGKGEGMPAVIAKGAEARWLDPTFENWVVLGSFLKR